MLKPYQSKYRKVVFFMSLEIMTSVDLNENSVDNIPDDIHTVGGKRMHALDSELSSTSENPVQNKAIKEAVDDLNTRIDGINVGIDDVTIKRNADEELYGIGAGYYVDDTLKGEVFNYISSNVASGQYSHAEGDRTIASGACSHAEGTQTSASGPGSHAEGGSNCVASGAVSHAEGVQTTASGIASHAEGSGATASGDISHAEGYATTASAQNSHAEGGTTTASAQNSHAEGGGTRASGAQSHAEGASTTASGAMSHAEGLQTTASGVYSHTEGISQVAYNPSTHGTTEENIFSSWINTNRPFAIAFGEASHSEGHNCISLAKQSHAEGEMTCAKGYYSHSEGYQTFARFNASHAEGSNTTAYGMYTHTEGFGSNPYRPVQYGTTASSISSSASSSPTLLAYGEASHAEGYNTLALGTYSHAEGYKTEAWEYHCHAEGSGTKAIGTCSHAEGQGSTTNVPPASVISTLDDTSILNAWNTGAYNIAKGNFSHTEGYGTLTLGSCSHAEGELNAAYGEASHAEGYRVIARGLYSHAEGKSDAHWVPGMGTDAATILRNWNSASSKCTLAFGRSSHAEGYNTLALSYESHSEGRQTVAYGAYSHAENDGTIAYGDDSHAEGCNTTAYGIYSHAEGYSDNRYNPDTYGTTAESIVAKAKEWNTGMAYGLASHTEGSSNFVATDYSHAEGYLNFIDINTSSSCSHVEGRRNLIEGTSIAAHVEGESNTVTHGYASHVSGILNKVYGPMESIHGLMNTFGDFAYSSFAVGQRNIINRYSAAIGCNLISPDNQVVLGNSNLYNGGAMFIDFNVVYKTNPSDNTKSLIYNQNYAIVVKDDQDNVTSLAMFLGGYDSHLTKSEITRVLVNGIAVNEQYYSLNIWINGAESQPILPTEIDQYYLIIQADGFTVDPDDEYTIAITMSGTLGGKNIFSIGNGPYAADEDCDALHRANALEVTYNGNLTVQNNIYFKYKDSSDNIHKISAQKMVDALLSLGINISDLHG